MNINDPVSLINHLLSEIKIQISNIETPHCSEPKTFIQVWKNNWNNEGKTGVHIELKPTQGGSFIKMYGKENFKITMSLHNESTTRKLGVEIPEVPSRTREYSFLREDRENSIKILIRDIKRLISEVEDFMDKEFKKLK